MKRISKKQARPVNHLNRNAGHEISLIPMQNLIYTDGNKEEFSDLNCLKMLVWESLPTIAGGQKVFLDIMQGLKDEIKIEAVVPSRGPLSKTLQDLGVPYNILPIGNYTLGNKTLMDVAKLLLKSPSVIFKGYALIKKNSYDLIYANSSRVFIWATIIGTLTEKPVIWHVHNLITDKKTKYLFEFFGRLKSVKKIIGVSNSAIQQFPKLRTKGEIIYNGIDTSSFTPRSELTSKVKRELGLSTNERTIGIIADLIPQKGQETFIRAARLILQKSPQSKFVLVGKPRPGFNWYEVKLKKLVEQFNIRDKFLFLGYRGDINNILNILDLIVISSSIPEACPMVLLEAYACGVPVIGSKLGGIPELIIEGETGYTYEAKNANDLADKIITLYKNPDLLAQMKKNCRKCAVENYDKQIFLAKIKSILKSETD